MRVRAARHELTKDHEMTRSCNRLCWTTMAVAAGFFLATAALPACADHGTHCPGPDHYPMPNIHWVPHPDWRTEDWSGEGCSASFRRKTQAFSLAMEAYFCSRRCWPPATRYYMPIMEFNYLGKKCGPLTTRCHNLGECQ
jgi:hypothetical protein